MSVWTYVTAIFDGIDDDANIESLGKTVYFDSPGELWEEFGAHPRRFAPTGSEGSLVIKHDTDSRQVRAIGALRDYMNENALIKWTLDGFRNLHAKKATIIIQCNDLITVTFK